MPVSTGGSFCALTVRVKVVLLLAAPSETRTVITEEPD